MSSLIQNIIILGGIIVILGLGYYLYTQNSELDGGGNANIDAQIATDNADFLRRLQELRAIDLSGDIFNDPRFLSLVNFSAPVITEPVGRVNPFEVSN